MRAIRSAIPAAEDGRPSAGGGLGRNNPQAATHLTLRSRQPSPAEDVSDEFTARPSRTNDPAIQAPRTRIGR
jgi:hypothetical protein